MLSEPILVVAQIVNAFDTLGVEYVVGGSLASSVYGIPRATQDVDLVAKMNAAHAEPLARLLRSDFYVDVDMILDAVRRRASFNVIHLATMFKADVFVMNLNFALGGASTSGKPRPNRSMGGWAVVDNVTSTCGQTAPLPPRASSVVLVVS